jgi:hypothetical protein
MTPGRLLDEHDTRFVGRGAIGRGLGVVGKLSPKGDKPAVYCLEFGTARSMPTRGALPYFELVIELEDFPKVVCEPMTSPLLEKTWLRDTYCI